LTRQTTEQFKQALALITAASGRESWSGGAWKAALDQTTVSDEEMIRALAYMGNTLASGLAEARESSVDAVLHKIGQTLAQREIEESDGPHP
jgi:hypothetical protein